MSEAIYRATQTITPNDLPRMVLYQRDLPAALRHFLPTRDHIPVSYTHLTLPTILRV